MHATISTALRNVEQLQRTSLPATYARCAAEPSIETLTNVEGALKVEQCNRVIRSANLFSLVSVDEAVVMPMRGAWTS